MRLFLGIMGALLVTGQSVRGEQEAVLSDKDRDLLSRVRDEFATSPRVVRLSVFGQLRSVCFIYVDTKAGNTSVMSVRDAGPGDSCAGEVTDYVGVGEQSAIERGLVAYRSRFTGQPYEVARIGAEKWRYVRTPSAIYYKVADPKTGREHWDAVCTGLMQYDDERKAGFRSIVYPRENSHEAITGFRTPEIKCGGIQFAVRNEIPTEKPKFLGSAEELEKLTRSNARATNVGQAKPNH